MPRSFRDELDALRGDRVGQLGIRISDQWRLFFVSHDGGVLGVEIVDYH